MWRQVAAMILLAIAALPLAAQELTTDLLRRDDPRPRVLTYKTVGEQRLRVHVYAPIPTPAAPASAVLFIHGGGWSAPGPWRLAPYCRYFARRGMVAVNVEYRLAGKDSPVRLGDCIADCRDAVRFVRAQAAALGIDPNRIAVAGESSGGHLAAAVAMISGPDPAPAVRETPDALILYNPCLDLAAIPWMAGHPAAAPIAEIPATVAWQDRVRPYSPIAFVRKSLPPTLLLHGTEDQIVPSEQAERFARAMRAAGNRIDFKRMPGWTHAFAVPDVGTDAQVIETLRQTDAFLAGLGYLKGQPTITGSWQPPAYHPIFSGAERQRPYVQARSHDLRYWPYLDGQWLGIVNDPDGHTWFSFSSHSGTQHAQLFRYDAGDDRVDHIADLGQACGEKLTGNPPQDKIHGAMFVDGDYVLAGTCEGHVVDGKPYKGGYWLKINRHTGEITNLGKSISEDGLLCVGYDPVHKRLYGHTNRKGWLTRLDLETGKERMVGVPWQDVIDAWKADPNPKKPAEIWPRGLSLMITRDGRVFGAKPKPGTFWCYDPTTEALTTFRVDMPLPRELQALKDAGKTPDAETQKQWNDSSFHLAQWDDRDQCFYIMRSFDQMLCRWYPPTGQQPARLETLHEMGLTERRYNLRPASCTLVLLGRTVYYTPHTGWGGVTHLTSYNLDTKTFTDHGPIVVEGDRLVNECHALVAARDGKLHLAAFVFSREGSGDPVTPWGMRDKYPFHSRFVVIDPKTDLNSGFPAAEE